MATAVHCGRGSIATTGTAVALAGAQEVNWCIIVADPDNERPLVIGDSGVTRSEAATDGARLSPGQPLPPTGKLDLAELFVNGIIGDSWGFVAGSGT